MNLHDLPDFIAVVVRLLQRNLAWNCDRSPEIEHVLAPIEVEAVLILIEVAADRLSESFQGTGGAKEAGHDHE